MHSRVFAVFLNYKLNFKNVLTITFICSALIACGGGGESNDGPDWVIQIDTSAAGQSINKALLGHYDLSGVLYDYDTVTNLNTNMQAAGFAEWRIGIGRWEIGTRMLQSLTDTTLCPTDALLSEPPGTTDLDLINDRSWFTDDGMPVALIDTQDDARYNLAYIRNVIDMAQGFGANPYISIDTMPFALAANQTPNRTDCTNSFMNAVTNNAPADNTIFSQAVKGMVQRVIEGSGGQAGRSVSHWEVWNEPELTQFWQPGFPAGVTAYFDMATAVLIALDDYRTNSLNADAQAIKIGLGSFAFSGTAVAAIQGYDGSNVPLDFISFHSYSNDPLDIVADIEAVANASAASTDYQDIELVLAEWGSDLAATSSNPAYANSMQPPLLMSSVLVMGAATGLDRAHHAIIYDYHPAITLGLVDNSGNRKPLFYAYQLLAEMIPDGAVMYVPSNAAGNRTASWGSMLITRDMPGRLRALLINRDSVSHVASIEDSGGVLTAANLMTFSDHTVPPQSSATSTTSVTVPAQSMVLIEFQ